MQHLFIYAFPAVTEHSYLLYHLFGVAGELGVRIFFCISGFVITRLFVLEEAEFGSISLKSFYMRRLFRIVPVFYALVLTVCLFNWLGWTPMDLGAIVRSALFLQDL